MCLSSEFVGVNEKRVLNFPLTSGLKISQFLPGTIVVTNHFSLDFNSVLTSHTAKLRGQRISAPDFG